MSEQPAGFIMLYETMLKWRPADGNPLQLADKIVLAAIIDRIRLIGPRFGVRLLADLLGVNPNTVTRSIAKLERAGALIVTRTDYKPGQGVRDRHRKVRSGPNAERRNSYKVVWTADGCMQSADTRCTQGAYTCADDKAQSAYTDTPKARTPGVRKAHTPASTKRVHDTDTDLQTPHMAGGGDSQTSKTEKELRAIGVSENMARELARDPDLTVETVHAAEIEARKQGRKDIPASVVGMLRDPPPQLRAAITAIRATEQRRAAEQAAHDQTDRDRKTIAAAEPDTVWAAIPEACRWIRSVVPSANPESEYQRFRDQCRGDSGQFAGILDPTHAAALVRAIQNCEPVEGVA